MESRSASTLRVRLSSLSIFERWARAELWEQEPFPATETMVFRYLKHCQSASLPPSRGPRLVQAVTLCAALFGVDGGQEVTMSVRITGKMKALKKAAPERVPRFPFTVRPVDVFENALFSEASGLDRAAAGFLLFCVSTRARLSNSQRVENELELDVDSDGWGYVVAKPSAMKAKEFPCELIGPARFFSARPWAEHWLTLRAETGLDASRQKCFLPIPLPGLTWSNRAAQSGALCDFTRELLVRGGVDPADVSNAGTHNAKATLLSMMAKWGAAAELRRAFGYHSAPGERVSNLYARDPVFPALLKLQRTVSYVRRGALGPDLTRTGRFLKGVFRAEGVERAPDRSTLDGQEEEQEESEEAEAQSEEEIQDPNPATPERVRKMPLQDREGQRAEPVSDASEGVPTEKFSEDSSSESNEELDQAMVLAAAHSAVEVECWEHLRTRTVHLAEPGAAQTKGCGKFVRAGDAGAAGAFARLPGRPLVEELLCGRCVSK